MSTLQKTGGYVVLKALFFTAIVLSITGYQVEVSNYDTELGAVLFSTGFWLFVTLILLTTLVIVAQKTANKD